MAHPSSSKGGRATTAAPPQPAGRRPQPPYQQHYQHQQQQHQQHSSNVRAMPSYYYSSSSGYPPHHPQQQHCYLPSTSTPHGGDGGGGGAAASGSASMSMSSLRIVSPIHHHPSTSASALTTSRGDRSGGASGAAAASAANNTSSPYSLTATSKDSTQSLSAGSTASIDSFVNLFLLSDNEHEYQRPLGMSTVDDSHSSSFSFDPYLSRRRKPSWASSKSEAEAAAPVVTATATAPPAMAVSPARSIPVVGRGGGGDMRKLYVPQRQRPKHEQQHVQQQPRRGWESHVFDDEFARQQRDIALQLEQLSVTHDDNAVAVLRASPNSGSGNSFPRDAPLHSSFFTSESLALRRDRDQDEDDNTFDDDDATDEQGFPRYLTSIPTPTMARMQQRGALHLATNRQRSLLDVASVSVATFPDDDDPPLHHQQQHSKAAASYSSTTNSSSAKTADAGVHSLPDASKANDSEKDRRAIQTVLHWRHIVSLRSQNSPRWMSEATYTSAQASNRRATRPSVALAKAHVELGNALLNIQEYSEACKSFQAAYRILGAQPNAAHRHIVGMALCMERMGVATALATDPITQVDPELTSTSHAHPSSVQDHVRNDPTFAMLVRAYTVQLEALRLRSLHLGSHHIDVITGLNHIAKLHCHNHDWVTALQCLWQVYWARTAVFGSVHPSCGVAAHDVANVFGHLHMFDDAVNFYSIARHVYDTLNLPDHNPALRKLNRDVRRLERLEHKQGYNAL